MSLTLEMPADPAVVIFPLTAVNSDADIAADLLDTPTPATDSLPAGEPPGESPQSNGHAETMGKRNYWIIFPRQIYHEIIAAGVEVQSHFCDSDTHDRMFVRCTDETKSAVESRFHDQITWQTPVDHPVQTEPLCEATDELPPIAVVGSDLATAKEPPSDRLRPAESLLLECSLEIYECELQVESAKDRLKSLREVHAELASEVQRLRSGLSAPSGQVKGEPDKSTATGEVAAPADSAGSEAARPAAVDPSTTATDWRSILTLKICGEPSPIKGLGAGKLATLAEKYPTLGDLEDARTAAGEKGLHTVLPNGCGKGIGEALTERIIHWLTKTRDAAAFAELSGPGELPPADEYNPATEPTLPASDAPLAAPTTADKPAKPKRPKKGTGNTSQQPLPIVNQVDPSPSFSTWESMSEAEQQKFILDRAAALNTGQKNCLEPKHPAGGKLWDSGYAANGNPQFKSVVDCPYIPGAEQDDWIRGWLSKDAINLYEGKGDAPTSTTSPGLSSLDDLL